MDDLKGERAVVDRLVDVSKCIGLRLEMAAVLCDRHVSLHGALKLNGQVNVMPTLVVHEQMIKCALDLTVVLLGHMMMSYN